MPNKPKQKSPNYPQMVKAMAYFSVIQEISETCRQAHMQSVAEHLDAACNEIENVWQRFGRE